MRPRFIMLCIVMAIFLGACGGGNPAATPTPVPTDTPLIPPTVTGPPVSPLAILVLPADLEPDTSNLYQKTVYDLTQASGMRFQVRNALTLADLEPGLQVVIVLPPDPGLAARAGRPTDSVRPGERHENEASREGAEVY